MIQIEKTDIQQRIQETVTNGVGYLPLDYLPHDSPYFYYLSEEEVKNTKNGLKFNLSVMNFDRDMKKYWEYSEKGNLISSALARIHYANFMTRNENFRDKAVYEAIKNKGGIVELFIERKVLKDNTIYFLDFLGRKE